MKVGVAFPAQVGGADRRAVRDFAIAAERHGLDSVWVLDRLVYDSLAPLPLLAAAALVTERVRLGTAILLAGLHAAVPLAKELATIDVLSGGRLTVGVGLGGREIDYDAAGVPMKGRVRRFEETIRTLRTTWAGGPVGPRPVQRPGPPLVIGGRSDAALARAVRLGDGYVMGRSGPTGLVEQLARVAQELARQRRDPLGFARIAVTFFAMGDDDERAFEVVSAYLGRYYGGEPEQLRHRADTVFGRTETAAQRLGELAAASASAPLGAHTLVLVPASTGAEQVPALAAALRLAGLL